MILIHNCINYTGFGRGCHYKTEGKAVAAAGAEYTREHVALVRKIYQMQKQIICHICWQMLNIALLLYMNGNSYNGIGIILPGVVENTGL